MHALSNDSVSKFQNIEDVKI